MYCPPHPHLIPNSSPLTSNGANGDLPGPTRTGSNTVGFATLTREYMSITRSDRIRRRQSAIFAARRAHCFAKQAAQVVNHTGTKGLATAWSED